jgi:hypothetical protein
VTGLAHVLALTLSWDPTIRGYLVVATGVVVLCGSVYMLLATNTGVRLGFLIAAAGLTGWMTIMGTAWWLYGIGWVGPAASWKPREVVVSDNPDDTSAAVTRAAQDLSDWKNLPEGGGDAAAAADEALTGDDSPLATFDSTQDYTQIAAKETGGKDPNSLRAELPGPNPPHWAVIQVRPVVKQEVPFGETPPPAKPDPNAQVFTVVLERNLGAKRLVPASFTIVCAIFFGVICNVLHRRDKAATEARARAAAG